ncbi:hypothetical protein P8452_21829 [Trifolium repens]|nr:hypothetical protein P8452_21829 [Trifolium repens]
MTDAARESLYHMVEETENGVTVSRRRPRFPLAWSDEQFKKSTDSYLIKDKKLSEEEKVGLEALKAFVAQFRPGPCVTREGSPVLDEDGKLRFGARHINTKGVLKAPNSAARKELLDNMADFAKEFLKHAAVDGKKKGKKGAAKSTVSAMWLVRPVLETHGWDHDVGYEGLNVESCKDCAGSNYVKLLVASNISKEHGLQIKETLLNV